MSFGSALGSFGRTFPQGIDSGMSLVEKFRQARNEREAADAYGAILRSMAAQSGGAPRAMPSTGSFQPMPPGGMPQGQPPQNNVIPFQPGGVPQMKPPMSGPPTAQPMPGGPPPQQQAPSFMQNGADAMHGRINEFGPPQPQMGQPDSMSRPQTGGGNMGPPGQGGGLQNLSLQQIVVGIRQAQPGISDAALGVAVDKFLPMMNAQAQLQYRMGMLGLGQQRIDQGQQRINETGRHNQVGETDRARRLAQFDRGLAQRDQRIQQMEKSVYARLPPAAKAQVDALRVQYNEDSRNYRQAVRDASFHADDPSFAQDVSDARAIMTESQREYMDFIEKLNPEQRQAPGGYLYGLPVVSSPAGAPSGGSPGAKPPAKVSPQAPGKVAPAVPAGQPVGKGPAGQDLFPLAAPGGKGGPLLNETSGVVGPMRERGVGPDTQLAGAEPNMGTRATPPVFASRGPGDREVPIDEDLSPTAVDVAQGMGGDYTEMRTALAQIKAAHQKLTQTMAQTPDFRRGAKGNTKANDAANQRESEALNSGSSFRNGVDSIRQQIEKLGTQIDEMMHGSDPLTRRSRKRKPPKDAGDIPMPSSPRVL